MKIHKRSTPETRKRLSLNLGLLLATLGGLAVLSLGVWGIHSIQMSRVSTGLLVNIADAKEKADWGRAAKLLQRYMLMWPKATEQKVELAEVFDKVAASLPEVERLVSIQTLALGVCELDPELKPRATQIRRRMVERLMDLGRQEDAMDQIAELAEPTLDIALERLFALCRYQLAIDKRTHSLRNSQLEMKWLADLNGMYVPDLLNKALLDNPGDIELSKALAEVCLGDPALLRNSRFAAENSDGLKAQALSIVDRMVTANREDPRAWLARYMVSSRVDRVAAESDIRQALKMAPDDGEVLKQAGRHYLERAQSVVSVGDSNQKELWLESASKYFQQVRDSSADRDANLFLGLGEVLREQGKLDEALSVWRDGVRICVPPTVGLHFQIVNSLIVAKRFSDALEALREMDEAVRVEGPIMPRSSQGYMSRVAQQQWSSYYITTGDYRSATGVLEQVVSTNQEMDALNRAELFDTLASTYASMEQWDRAAIAYEEAVRLSPTIAKFHRGAANAWFKAQRYGEALKQLQFIDYKSGQDWLQIAETVLEIQRTNRPDPSLWVMFDNALVDAKRLQTSDSFLVDRPWAIEFIGTEALPVRGTGDEQRSMTDTAAEGLYALCLRYPTEDELWRKSIFKLRRWGKSELSGQLLEQLSSRALESTDAAITQAEVMTLNGMAGDARRVLERRLEVDPENDILKRTLAEMRGLMGDWEEVYDDMNRVVVKDIRTLRILCKRALQARIFEKESDLENAALVQERLRTWNANVEGLEQELRKLEGEEGTDWRYIRAKRLLVKMGKGSESELAEVVDIANYLERKRPSWGLTHWLSGNLSERQSNAPRAIQQYTRAVQLGMIDLEVFERLATLLYQQGLLAEASSLIERLGVQASNSPELTTLALSLKEDNKSEMIVIARNGTIARPTDPMAWVWYAKVLEVSSRGFDEEKREASLEEAKVALSKANKLTEDSEISVLGAEFTFYMTLGDDAKVAEVVSRIRSNDKIAPITKWMALAQISQSMGLVEDASNAYEEAIKAGGDRVEIGRRVAQLYLSQGNQDLAIVHFRKVLQEAPKDIDTKRSLATLLASRGTQEDWKQVEALLVSDKAGSTPDDRRLEAELKVQRGTPSDLAAAQYLLEGLVNDPNNRTDEDRFRLASVYLLIAKLNSIQDKDMSQSRQLILEAGRHLKDASLGSQSKPEYIYTYGNFLLRQDRYREALEQSERLSLADPDGLSSALLKAQLQKADDRPDAAKSTILSWLDSRRAVQAVAKNATASASLMVQAGQALVLLGFTEEAEQYLRQAFELDASTGMDYVASLARSDDSVARKRAIQYLVERVKQDRSTSTAKLLANLLSSGRVDADLQKLGEDALSGIQLENGADVELLSAVAEMHAQTDAVKAIETYQRIIKLKPDDVVALNNLANLLADQPNGTTQAIEYIDQAILIGGRQPLLLDTKGVILMTADRVDEAIPVFEIAAAASQDPRVIFHLYLALTRAGRTEEANRARGKLNVDVLKQTMLTPQDRLELERLQGVSL
jgi:tetratricopeptide (TPR) repeat protein